MSMERLCLIFCCICVSAVLFAHEQVMKLSHSPVQLRVRLGEMAVFTCNLTVLNFTPEDVNWYKTDAEPTKIADVKNTHSNRLSITTDWGQKKAVLYIKNVTLNDSGLYYCGHLNMDKNGLIFISNTSELIVENLNYSVPTVNNQTKKNGQWDQKSEHSEKNIVIATSILLVLLLMVLIGIAAFLVRYKQRNKMPQPQLRHLERPCPDPDVYTVDYGVLDFENNQPYRKSSEISVQEQVEYATIMFP